MRGNGRRHYYNSTPLGFLYPYPYPPSSSSSSSSSSLSYVLIVKATAKRNRIEKMAAVVFLVSFFSYMMIIGANASIYDVLKNHGLPIGLFPNGVKEFKIDDKGDFEVRLDQACNVVFDVELHYEMSVTGHLSSGRIGDLSGISAQDLFLWFPVKEIRVDVPSSGLIYFDVGVVHKQFSLSLFESPKDCVAVRDADLEGIRHGKYITQALDKSQPHQETSARHVM